MIHPDRQTGLFKYKLNESGCSEHQAILLFEAEFLSFDPKKREEFEWYEIEELRFLKILYFDSGLSINIVKAMLNKLEKPYKYSFNQIYWDYGLQEWKELPQNIDDYINDNLKDVIFDNFDKFLESVEEDDMENLSTINDSINKQLEKLKL